MPSQITYMIKKKKKETNNKIYIYIHINIDDENQWYSIIHRRETGMDDRTDIYFSHPFNHSRLNSLTDLSPRITKFSYESLTSLLALTKRNESRADFHFPLRFHLFSFHQWTVTWEELGSFSLHCLPFFALFIPSFSFPFALVQERD